MNSVKHAKINKTKTKTMKHYYTVPKPSASHLKLNTHRHSPRHMLNQMGVNDTIDKKCFKLCDKNAGS